MSYSKFFKKVKFCFRKNWTWRDEGENEGLDGEIWEWKQNASEMCQWFGIDEKSGEEDKQWKFEGKFSIEWQILIT